MRRLGFVGIGAIACRHAEVALFSGAEVAACYMPSGLQSRNLPRFQQTLGAASEQLTVHRSLHDLLTDSRLDGVVCAAPWDAIPVLLPELLRCQLPVLCEKPVALRSADIYEATHREPPLGAQLQVAMNRRFYEPVAALAARLARGDLLAVEARCSEHLEHHRQTTGAAVIPYLLQFTSIHSIDLLLWLLRGYGAPQIDVAHTRDRDGFREVIGQCRLPRGNVPVQIQWLANRALPVGIACHFHDDSSWVLSPLEVLTVYRGVSIGYEKDNAKIRTYQPNVEMRLDAYDAFKPGFLSQMRCWLTRSQTATRPTLHDAWASLHFLESMAYAT